MSTTGDIDYGFDNVLVQPSGIFSQQSHSRILVYYSMTPERFCKLRQVLDRRQPDLTVLLDNVHKPHNFSAILRSCDSVGVLEAHGVWPDPKLRPHRHIASGSARWVKVRTHPTLESGIGHLRQQGLQILAAHLSARAQDFREADYTRPTAVLLGSELHGIGREGVRLADGHITIPMQGMVQSLNVSVAAAIILFEAQRQRVAAGLYESPKLDRVCYRRTLFEWAHPDVASYCRNRGLDYPQLDEDGEIIGRVT